MPDAKTGRPPKYIEAQVLKGIELVEQTGDTPTGDTVKKMMCAQLGVPGGINAQSLDREVQRLLEERERARRERLVAALPPATKTAAKEIAARLEDAVLDHMAEEHDHLRSAAAKKVVDLRDDLSCQRAQIRELLSQIDDKDDLIAEIEGAKHELEGRLEAATAEIALLNERIAERNKEEDFRAQMLNLMKDTLAQHAPAAE